MQKHLWILVLVGCIGLIGCGSKSGSGSATGDPAGDGASESRPNVTADRACQGTYVLDPADLEAAILEAALARAPEAARTDPKVIAEAKAAVKTQAAAMHLTCDLNADGTWAARGRMGGETVDAKGAWKLSGEKLSLTTTEEDGKTSEEPETVEATLKDGILTVQPEGTPFPIPLKRK